MTTTDIRRRPAAGPAAPVPVHRRLLGLGGVFGRAVRDSRRVFIVELALLGLFLLVVLAGVASAYPTQAARDELVRLANDIGPPPRAWPASPSTSAPSAATCSGSTARSCC
jgi:hypothetical protein